MKYLVIKSKLRQENSRKNLRISALSMILLAFFIYILPYVI